MIYELKIIEFRIFYLSFMLIDKYVKPTQGFQKAFNEEHNCTKSLTDNGYLNWHNVLPKQLEGCKGFGYLRAIEIVCILLISALANHKWRDGSEIHIFYEIKENVNKLINFRIVDKRKSFERYGNEEERDKHEKVINAWIKFKDDFCEKFYSLHKSIEEREQSSSAQTDDFALHFEPQIMVGIKRKVSKVDQNSVLEYNVLRIEPSIMEYKKSLIYLIFLMLILYFASDLMQ